MSINKNRSLVAIIIFLLLTNVVMVIFFIFFNGPQKSSPGNEKGKFSTALKEDVGFTQEQLAKYQALRKTQLEQVKPYFEEVREAKLDLYNLLFTMPVPDSAVQHAAELIGARQKELDVNIFHHFERVRGLCTPEQLPKFDTAMNKLVKRMISHRGK